MTTETMTKASTIFGDALDLYSPIISGQFTATGEAVPESPKLESKPYARPTGETYYSRIVTIGSTQFEDVAFIQTAHEKKMPVLLYGAPGTGKTALVEAALENVVTVQGTAETETADFIGSWTQNHEGKYVWVDGPLVEAADGGKPLLIDEIALVDPRVMAVVYGLMDGRDTLTITANPERADVVAKEGFVVFGSCNPDVPGAIMSDALLSRFMVHIEVKTDWTVASRLGVGAKIIQVARNLQIKKDSGQVTAAPQIRELITFKKVSAQFGKDLAINNFVSSARPEDRSIYIDAVNSVFGSTAQTLTF